MFFVREKGRENAVLNLVQERKGYRCRAVFCLWLVQHYSRERARMNKSRKKLIMDITQMFLPVFVGMRGMNPEVVVGRCGRIIWPFLGRRVQ